MPNKPEFVVRTATLDDADAIARFNINIAWETENIVLLPEVIGAGVKNLMENPERGFYLVVDAKVRDVDAVVAASLMVTNEWSDWRNGTFWWIQSVYVLSEWRRHGLYKMMYDRVRQLAEKKDNVCGFRLYVEQENTIAQTTYKAMGMHRTHYQMFEELTPGLSFQQS